MTVDLIILQLFYKFILQLRATIKYDPDTYVQISGVVLNVGVQMTADWQTKLIERGLRSEISGRQGRERFDRSAGWQAADWDEYQVLVGMLQRRATLNTSTNQKSASESVRYAIQWINYYLSIKKQKRRIQYCHRHLILNYISLYKKRFVFNVTKAIVFIVTRNRLIIIFTNLAITGTCSGLLA